MTNYQSRNHSHQQKPTIRIKKDNINGRDHYQDKFEYHDNRANVRTMGAHSPDVLAQIRNSHEFDFTNKRNMLPMSENLDRVLARERKGKKSKKHQNSPAGSQFTLRLD